MNDTIMVIDDEQMILDMLRDHINAVIGIIMANKGNSVDISRKKRNSTM